MFKSRARERQREGTEDKTQYMGERNDPNLTACMRLSVNQTGRLPECEDWLKFSHFLQCFYLQDLSLRLTRAHQNWTKNVTRSDESQVLLRHLVGRVRI